jgi:hypothetical protein
MGDGKFRASDKGWIFSLNEGTAGGKFEGFISGSF